MLKRGKTLEYIQELPKDEHGLFHIEYKDAMDALRISKKTVYRHIDKLLEGNGMSIIYKGGSMNSKLWQEILIDSRSNPFTYTSNLYSINKCTQLQRDVAILRKVLRWQEVHIEHYVWWSNADSLEYDECNTGMSLETTKLLSQYIKYMVKEDFELYEEYDDVYDKFVGLQSDTELSWKPSNVNYDMAVQIL